MKHLTLLILIYCLLTFSAMAGDEVMIQIAKGDSLYKLFDNELVLKWTMWSACEKGCSK